MKKRVFLTIAIILIVAVIMFTSFFGIYRKDENGVKRNIIPDYKMGMEFTNSVKIKGTVSEAVASQKIFDKDGNEVTTKEEGVEYTEENGYRIEETKVNSNEAKTLENYKKSKDIIKEKLDKLNVAEYNLTLNETNGAIDIEIPADNQAEWLEQAIQTPGSLIFIDTSNFQVVFSNEYIKDSAVVTRQGDMEVGVFLQIELTDEGINKLKELSEPVKVETNTEEGEQAEDQNQEEKTVIRQVFVLLNGMSLGTTEITNIIYDNTIVIPFIVSNNNDEINAAIKDTQDQSVILNAGTTPVVYEFNKETVESTFSVENLLKYIVALGVIAGILIIYMVIRFRAKGFISTYFQIGYFATLLLIIRLTNVRLPLEGIAGIAMAIIVNYMFNHIMLKNIDNSSMYKDTNIEFLFKTLPLFILSIVFTFSSKASVSSLGMTIFWGIMITYIYNFLFSKFIFENVTGGKNESN